MQPLNQMNLMAHQELSEEILLEKLLQKRGLKVVSAEAEKIVPEKKRDVKAAAKKGLGFLEFDASSYS
jgi:hypothetical protein